jgi:hypothetical protein
VSERLLDLGQGGAPLDGVFVVAGDVSFASDCAIERAETRRLVDFVFAVVAPISFSVSGQSERTLLLNFTRCPLCS